MPPYVSQWAPTRELQNAKFEGYKLDFNEEDDDIRTRIKFPPNAALVGRALRPLVEARLGYKEARSRAKWNHLALGDDGSACWVDSDGVVWMIDMSEDDTRATPRAVYTLPQPIGEIASSSETLAEYPVARFLRDTTWAISDGTGRLYVVDLAKGDLLGSYELPSPASSSLQPFRMHCVSVFDDRAVALLASVLPKKAPALKAGTSKSTKAVDQSIYQIQLVTFPLSRMSTEPHQLSPTSTLHGSDLPSFASFSRTRCCVGSTALYKSPASAFEEGTEPIKAHGTPYTPASDEISSIPQQSGSGSVPASGTAKAPPPYSWNQTSDEVTIVFALPTTTKTKDIRVFFAPSAVSLTVMPSSEAAEANSKLALPHLNGAKLWDTIDSKISTWTWEKTGGEKGKYGILALHIEKKNEDTRWPSVFKAKTDGNLTVDPAYLDVEETLDRSELLKITEALEKYTAELAGAGATGLQGGIEQRNSLLGDEIDLDLDAPEGSSGRGVLFTWINGIDTDSPALEKTLKAEMADLTSLPIAYAPTNRQRIRDETTSIIVKHDVDGLLFKMPDSSDTHAWTHASTYPALSFVLASKRDVVQVYHIRDKLCIGLESGSPLSSASNDARATYSSVMTARMNAYLYSPPPPGSKAKTAKQRVIGLADPQAGAVLGAAAIERSSGNVDLLVLCEKELVVLRGVVKA